MQEILILTKVPEQFTPSPLKPCLQLHSNDPGLFIHCAFDEQLLALDVAHSFTSTRE